MANYQKYTNDVNQVMFVATEHVIYGSNRLGIENRIDSLYKNGTYNPAWYSNNKCNRKLGLKSFELSNHLGNVLVTVSDKKVYTIVGSDIVFEPEITTISDYYPFGCSIAIRSYSSGVYRYGFNGMEKDKDDEGMGGGGSTYDYGFRIYNPNLGKFLSVDPLAKKYPELTPYQFTSNMPIWAIDLDGLEACVAINGKNTTGPYSPSFIKANPPVADLPKAPPVNSAITPVNNIVNNFDWATNANKLNDVDLWTEGGAYKGIGPLPTYKTATTAVSSSSFTYVFSDPQSITKWNDQKADAEDIAGTVAGASVAIVGLLAKIHPAVDVVAGVATDLFMNNLPATDVNCNPGYKLITTSKIEVVRSTDNYYGANYVNITITSTMYDDKGNVVQLLSNYSEKIKFENLYDEISGGFKKDINDNIKFWENIKSNNTDLTNPNYNDFFNIKLIRTN